MGDRVTFPATLDEFAEQYKIVDKQEVYTNGAELIPIFRVKQWLEDADVKTKSEWISVDERLPEESGRYLAYVKISHLAFEGITMVVIMAYNKINGFDTISGEETVTHWMPLPQPPKMKGKDGEGE